MPQSLPQSREPVTTTLTHVPSVKSSLSRRRFPLCHTSRVAQTVSRFTKVALETSSFSHSSTNVGSLVLSSFWSLPWLRFREIDFVLLAPGLPSTWKKDYVSTSVSRSQSECSPHSWVRLLTLTRDKCKNDKTNSTLKNVIKPKDFDNVI